MVTVTDDGKGTVMRDLGVYDVADAHPRIVESWVEEITRGANRPSQWCVKRSLSNRQIAVVGIYHDEDSARRAAGLPAVPRYGTPVG